MTSRCLGFIVFLVAACGGSGKVDPLGTTSITPLAPPPARPAPPQTQALCLQQGTTPRQMVDDDIDSVSIAIDDQYVYYEQFSDAAGRRVRRVPKTGGDPETVFADNSGQTVLVDGASIYVTDSLGHVTTFAASGAAPRAQTATMLDVDADSVFLIYSSDDVDSRLVRFSRAGGAASFVADGQAGSVRVDGDTVYWTEGVWVGALHAMTKGGSSSRVVFDGPVRSPAGFAIADDAFYVAQDKVGITRVPRDGGAPTVIAPAENATTVQLDGDFVYWTDYQHVYVVPKTGGPSKPLASFDDTVLVDWALAIDEHCVYFTAATHPGDSISQLFTVPKVALP
jgi:hypothetical protein